MGTQQPCPRRGQPGPANPIFPQGKVPGCQAGWEQGLVVTPAAMTARIIAATGGASHSTVSSFRSRAGPSATSYRDPRQLVFL